MPKNIGSLVPSVNLDPAIEVCDRLRSENEELRASRDELASGQEQLLEKNREARRRIERIIDRLRTLEGE